MRDLARVCKHQSNFGNVRFFRSSRSVMLLKDELGTSRN